MSAGDPAIVVAIREQLPSFMLLAGDIGFASLSLRIQRVEVLFQPLFRALAGIDCSADAAHHWSPKKRGPDQCAPVMCFAMADSDRQVLPSMTYPLSTTSTW